MVNSSVLTDIKTAAGVFKDIRQSRKDGREIVIQKRVVIPVMGSVGLGFYDTVEGCTLSNCGNDIDAIARNAFRGLSNEEKYKLSGVPKDGEFIERANFWRELLRPVMTPRQYGVAITAILHWYIHIKHLREDGEIC